MLVLGILLATNFIFSYFSIRLDTSEGQAYSISDGSKKILKKLEDTILVKVVFSSKLPPPYNLNEQYVRDLLAEYKRASGGKMRVEFIDPEKSSKDRQEAAQTGVVPIQIDERSSNKRQLREVFMGVAIFYGDKHEAIPFLQDTRSVEYEITQRIKKLIDPTKPKIGIVSSGKALLFSDEKLKVMQPRIEELYQIELIDLLQGDIPAGLSSVWLLGPEEELTPEMVAPLQKWVEDGGTLGLLLDTRKVELGSFMTKPQKHGLENMLQNWGVSMSPGLIVDPQSDRIQVQSTRGAFQMINVIDYPYIPLIIDVDRTHPVTKNLNSFSMPFVGSIEIGDQKSGIEYSSLAKSSEYSYLDSSPDNVSPIAERTIKNEFKKGPFDVVVSLQGSFGASEDKKGRVIIFGTSRFIRGDFPPRQNNYNLFLNMLDWSAQDEVLLSIRSKGSVYKPFKQMPEAARTILKYFIMLTLPLISILVGIIIWRIRKSRRAFLPLKYKEV